MDYNVLMEVYITEYQERQKKKLAWENSLTRMFNLTLQHCTPDLEGKLKTTTKYNGAYQARDRIALLGLIRDIVNDHMDDKNEVMVCVESDLALYMCVQGRKQPNKDYVMHFRAQVNTATAHGGHPCRHPAFTEMIEGKVGDKLYGGKAEANLSNKELQRVRKKAVSRANEKYLVCLFIALAD